MRPALGGGGRPMHCRASMPNPAQRPASVFQLAQQMSAARQAGSARFAAVERVLEVTHGDAHHLATPDIESRFGVPQRGSQLVVCVTDRRLRTQVWWNEVRSKKPQTFAAAAPAAGEADSTDGGRNCDFCDWERWTGTDTFGRVENESCVTASNLFKYAFPCHGLVIFRHHDPLAFTAAQVADLLRASSDWFRAASAQQPQAAWPLLIWNCLARAGASQYHGHAQVMLTEQPTPAALTLAQALEGPPGDGYGGSYIDALGEAHGSVGLRRSLAVGGARAHCHASLAPTKDKELAVTGASLACPAFAALLHGCLRTVIDRLGGSHFNAAVLNVSPGGAQRGPVLARVASRGSAASRASDFGGLEVFGGASIGHTDPWRVIAALDEQMAGQPGYSVEP